MRRDPILDQYISHAQQTQVCHSTMSHNVWKYALLYLVVWYRTVMCHRLYERGHPCVHAHRGILPATCLVYEIGAHTQGRGDQTRLMGATESPSIPSMLRPFGTDAKGTRVAQEGGGARFAADTSGATLCYGARLARWPNVASGARPARDRFFRFHHARGRPIHAPCTIGGCPVSLRAVINVYLHVRGR